MKHGKKQRKFGRKTKQRRALMRSLAVAVISKGKITTTQTRAKSLKNYLDKLVSRSKKNDLVAMRLLTSQIGAASAAKLMKEIGPRFSERTSGFSRLIKLPPRISDGSPMAIIELIQ